MSKNFVLKIFIKKIILILHFRCVKWILIPLHSSITNEEQARVFDIPPLNYRKIILSTNIAESSVTVPDVSYGNK